MDEFTSTPKIEKRAIIKFCHDLGKTPTQTIGLMEQAGCKGIQRSLVFRWHKMFKDGRDELKDERRTGRRKSRVDFVDAVRDVIYGDRRMTVRDICNETGMSYGTVYRILTDELHMRKVCARWIPRLLTDDNRNKRVNASKKFLRRYRHEGEEFLSRIVTTDETWLFLYDPETKEQSSQWKNTDSPPPKKARVCKSAGKQMYIFFMDNKGMILQHAVPTEKTVNAKYYSQVITNNLFIRIQNVLPYKNVLKKKYFIV